MNHHVLLHKLLSSGICINTFNWFKSYLTNRSQCVRWNGTQSDNLGISIGVPQGSILGPLFCILYVYNTHQLTCMQLKPLKTYHINIWMFLNINYIEIWSVLWNWWTKIITFNLKNHSQYVVIGTEQRLSNSRLLSIQVDSVIIEKVLCAKQVFTLTNVAQGQHMIISIKIL